MTEPTGTDRISAAYATSDDLAALRRRAATYDPTHDEQADHVATLDHAPPAARLAAAYQRTQRDAARQLAKLDREDTK